MEVVSLRASQLTQQLYSSSVRLFASSTSLQQQHQQLIAFCTLVTVALSVLLLSFNKHYAHYYPANHPVSRCLRCLTYVKRRVSIVSSARLLLRSPYYYPINNPLKKYTHRLKRLRTLASLPSKSIYYSYYYTSCYLLRPLNKMRKETKLRVKNIINIKSGMASKYGSWSSSRRAQTSANLSATSSNMAVSTQSLYCPACDAAVAAAASHEQQHFRHDKSSRIDEESAAHHDETGPLRSSNIQTSQSYPVFTSASTQHIHRNLTEPRIVNSKVSDKFCFFYYCYYYFFFYLLTLF